MKKLQYNSPVILSFFFLSLASLALGYMSHRGHHGGVVFRVPLAADQPLDLCPLFWGT